MLDPDAVLELEIEKHNKKVKHAEILRRFRMSEDQDGRVVTEIARIMGIPVYTVRKTLQKAGYEIKRISRGLKSSDIHLPVRFNRLVRYKVRKDFNTTYSFRTGSMTVFDKIW